MCFVFSFLTRSLRPNAEQSNFMESNIIAPSNHSISWAPSEVSWNEIEFVSSILPPETAQSYMQHYKISSVRRDYQFYVCDSIFDLPIVCSTHVYSVHPCIALVSLRMFLLELNDCRTLIVLLASESALRINICFAPSNHCSIEIEMYGIRSKHLITAKYREI